MIRVLCRLLLASLLVAPLQGRTGGLPNWAEEAVKAARGFSAPEGADAWVLLDRTVVSYRGDGEIRTSRTRVVQILDTAGCREGTYLNHGLGKSIAHIIKLRGWNLKPDGTTTRLDKDDLVGLDADALTEGIVSTDTLQLATLAEVKPGSVVAFESQESLRFPLGPVDLIWPLEPNPIRRYQLEMEKDLRFWSSSDDKTVSFKLESRNLNAWSTSFQMTTRSIDLENLPAYPSKEIWANPGPSTLPYMSLVFLDPALRTLPSLQDWNVFGAWVHRQYVESADAVSPLAQLGKPPKEALGELSAWMKESLSYRQVYLSPARGWIPEHTKETLRKRYGDCKDLATFLMGAAKAAGMEVWPVLARVGSGSTPLDAPVNPLYFNHVIAAVRIQASLGFPAEIQSRRGRFLLVDPTSRVTPLGWLPSPHRHGRVLICGPDGSEWVDIPDAAIPLEKVDCSIQGRLSPEGVFQGTMVVREWGDAYGFRSSALEGGTKGLRDRSLALSSEAMSPEWSVEIPRQSSEDSTPFLFTIKVRLAKAMVRKGEDFSLELPGTPGLPNAIVRVKEPRRFSIEVPQGIEWHWRARLDIGPAFPSPCTALHIGTPLREGTWRGKVDGPTMDLALDITRKAASWPTSAQEEGLKALRKDRTDFLRFLEEAFSLPSSPVIHSGRP